MKMIHDDNSFLFHVNASSTSIYVIIHEFRNITGLWHRFTVPPNRPVLEFQNGDVLITLWTMDIYDSSNRSFSTGQIIQTKNRYRDLTLFPVSRLTYCIGLLTEIHSITMYKNEPLKFCPLLSILHNMLLNSEPFL